MKNMINDKELTNITGGDGEQTYEDPEKDSRRRFRKNYPSRDPVYYNDLENTEFRS